MKHILAIILITLCSLCTAEEIPDGVIKQLNSTEFDERNKGEEELLKWINKLGSKDQQIKVVMKNIINPLSPQVGAVFKKHIKGIVIKDLKMGFLGVQHSAKFFHIKGELTPCIEIKDVSANTPASAMGLKRGDFILKVNDTPLTKLFKETNTDQEKALEVTNHFSYLIKRYPPSTPVKIEIFRDGTILHKEGKLMPFTKNPNNPFNRDVNELYFRFWWKENYEQAL